MFLIFCHAANAGQALGAEAALLPTLTTARQVQELTREDAVRGYPVRLRGVVTFHEPTWFLSFVQDATGGIYVRNFDPALQAGQQVEVESFAAPGRLLPIVTGRDGGQAQVRPRGPGQWPAPLEPAPARLGDDAYDAQWVSVRGKVTRMGRAHDGLILDLQAEGVPVRAAVPRWPQNWSLPGYLSDQEITARGVLGRKQLAADESANQPVLYVPAIEFITVVPEALSKLFDRPEKDFNRLFETEIARDRPQVRVRGQVQVARPGLGFFLTMAGGGHVWVHSSAPGKLAPGDFVDAVGWLDRFDGRPLLTDAYFRVERSGTLPARWARTAAEVSAAPDSVHGGAISVEGTLVEQQRGVNEDSLVLADRGALFLGRLLRNGDEQLPVFAHDTRLRLGGTCLARRMPLSEDLPPSFAFQLWLTSPGDVEIMALPPWWTVRRVFWLCGGILTLGLLAAGWVVLLRGQVARQTAVIGQQLERQAVAQERARIARELHDSLGQELVGIALQLDSAAARLPTAPQQAQQALTMARRMIRHSQAEVKRSVVDLRAEELDGANLPTALEELLQPLVATTGTPQLRLEVEGTPRRLEGLVEHHLLRIGQEAVANAVRHSNAAQIHVRLRYGEREVAVEVKDNGRGFDTTAAMALASGHFGLLGLRERANKLQGRLRIESQPGAGTVVSVTVPLNHNETP